MTGPLARRVLFASVALGAGSVVIGALASGYGPLSLAPDPGLPWLRHVSGFLGSPPTWGLFGLVTGYAAGRVGVGALATTGGLLVAVVSYYVAKAAVGITPWLDWSATAIWCTAALLLGPVLGLVGGVARVGLRTIQRPERDAALG